MTKTIILQEDGMLTTEPMPISEIANIMLAALTGAVSQVQDMVTDEDADKVDEELFNGLNEAFSICLKNCFPEMELHPDLTEEAIMEAENKILAERAGVTTKAPLKVVQGGK